MGLWLSGEELARGFNSIGDDPILRLEVGSWMLILSLFFKICMYFIAYII